MKKQPSLLTIYLIIIFLFSLASFGNYLSIILKANLFPNSVALILSSFPKWAMHVIGFGALINAIFIFQLYKQKKWAFFGVLAMTILAFILNLIYLSIQNALAGAIGFLILYLLQKPHWGELD